MDANLDKTNFTATLLVIVLVSVPLALNPEGGAALVQSWYAFIATNFGWLYALAGVGAMARTWTRMRGPGRGLARELQRRPE